MSEFKIGPLNHVGIAVPDLEDACETYRTLYGARDITTPFDMPDQGVKVCFERRDIEFLMFFTIIEGFPQGVGLGIVLVEDVEVESLRPPILI